MSSFNPSKIRHEKILGKGGAATVYAYHSKDQPDDKYAVKEIFARDIDQLLMFINEIVFCSACDHPNVLPAQGYYIHHNQYEQNKEMKHNFRIYLKMRRMKGSLQDLIKRKNREGASFTEEEIIKYFYGLTCGLKHIHDKKIVHRDMKPANVLYDNSNTLQITDTGIARLVDEENSDLPTDYRGTPAYSAPEVLNGGVKKKELFKADIWSLGVVIVDTCTATENLKQRDKPEEKEEKLVQALKKAEGKYSQRLLDLVRSLVRTDPDQRKTLDEVKKELETEYENILGLEAKKEEVVSKDGEANHPCVGVHNVKNEEKVKNTFKIEERKNEGQVFKMVLKCKDVKPTVEDIQSLSNYIGSELKSLKELKLDFTSCEKFDDPNLKYLASKISDVKYLENLDLNFSKCPNVSDLAMKELTSHFGSNLKEVSHLVLDFSECLQMSDVALNYLTIWIGEHLTNLKYVKLRFVNCVQITDAGLDILTSQLEQRIKQLESLSLNFKGSQVTQELKRDIENRFEKVRVLIVLV